MEKIKYFVFSDVHGEFDALVSALNEAGYDSTNKNHKLISVGDAFDRGPDSSRVYQFLTGRNAICVKGNHDEFFQEYLEKGMDGEFVLFNILHNGLGDTISSFTGLSDKNFDYKTVDRMKDHIGHGVLSWLKSLPLYYETQHFIFVHAGIDSNLVDWKMTDKDYMLWDIEDSHKPVHNTNKMVVIGHHHAFRVRQNAEAEGWSINDVNDITVRLDDPEGGVSKTKLRSYGNTDENRPYCYGNKIAIDGCTNLTKKVNVLVLEDYPIVEKKVETEETEDRLKVGDTITVGSYSGKATCTVSFDDEVRRIVNDTIRTQINANDWYGNIYQMYTDQN